MNPGTDRPLSELQLSILAALETYSNVHRGSGHNSMATTRIFENSRSIVLDHLGLSKRKYEVIFCTPRRAEALTGQLDPSDYQILSSQEIGVSLGVRALAVKKKAISRIRRFQSGGGTARLVAGDWIIWAGSPEKFEAGTPAIINIIAFARALQLIRFLGIERFRETSPDTNTAKENLYHDDLETYAGIDFLNELRKRLIGRDIHVPTNDGPKPFINLDNSASTRTFTPVWNTVSQAFCRPAIEQDEIVREVRKICSEALNAPLTAYDLMFTSNTTESINLVAESLCSESAVGLGQVILNTSLEHNSNDLPWRMIPGHSLLRIPADDDGIIDLNALESTLRNYNVSNHHGNKRIRLVAVTGASNVLGICNDLVEISRIVHKYDARLLVDAAQLVAHRKIDMERCGIDYLAFSGHKVYAPFGTGVLVARKGMLSFGSAELERIRHSGEENTIGIAALGKALILLQRAGMNLIQQEEQALTARALRGLSQIPGLTIYGVKDPDSSPFNLKGGVILFEVKGIFADRLAKELAERAGIGVRYGCHCSHMLIKHLLHFNTALERIQYLIVTLFPRIQLPGLTRVSLGLENSGQDIDTLITALGQIALKSGPKNKTVKKQILSFIQDAEQRVFSSLDREGTSSLSATR
jgi:selenocysteine lyase/cysteine desulfurase